MISSKVPLPQMTDAIELITQEFLAIEGAIWRLRLRMEELVAGVHSDHAGADRPEAAGDNTSQDPSQVVNTTTETIAIVETVGADQDHSVGTIDPVGNGVGASFAEVFASQDAPTTPSAAENDISTETVAAADHFDDLAKVAIAEASAPAVLVDAPESDESAPTAIEGDVAVAGYPNEIPGNPNAPTPIISALPAEQYPDLVETTADEIASILASAAAIEETGSANSSTDNSIGTCQHPGESIAINVPPGVAPDDCGEVCRDVVICGPEIIKSAATDRGGTTRTRFAYAILLVLCGTAALGFLATAMNDPAASYLVAQF